MKATWFENRELITLYTDPAYFGADVPDSYAKRPSKPVPVKSLFGYEPSSKMDDIHHKDEVLQIALKMKAGTWKGLPIVCRKDPKGYQVLDGHHRMHAARKAGLDTLDAVIVDREDIQYSDEVKEQVEEGWSQKYKSSIDCSNPKGFSQKAHCAGKKKKVNEASGYIPTAAQANDPRFKTALTVDVRPGEDQRNIEKLGLNLNMDLVNKTKPGKKRKKTLAESLMEQYQMFKEEDLVEVDMSPSALRSWAKSELAQGVRAGFELELILTDTEKLDDDQYDNEADMDADEPIGTLDEIVDFYNGPDDVSWETEQHTTEDQFRESVIEDLMEYEDEQFFDWWSDNGEDQVREEMEAELERNVTDEEFMEEFENEGEIFERVREREQDEHRGDITWAQFWEAKQIESMGDLMNVYDLYFPYVQGAGGGSKEIGQWADEISEITGKGTNVSYQYHGDDKEAGKYTIEPDSSLTADDEFDAGIELVSPVMPLDEALDQLEKLFNFIEEKDGDIYTNQSTGLHMNISVPQGNDIDYTKLVLFSGDKFILDKYNRLSNNYANSALGQLEARAAQLPPEKAAQAMQKMKDNLEDTAEEYVRAGTGQAKYTSIHIKDGYIEFRGPGGVYTNKSFGENMNTMLRFARAMTIAADPQAYRQEYQKKLYKTLSKSESSERTIDSLFADFQSGEINKEVFKKRWANLVVKQQQNQAILNKLDDRPDDKRLAKAKQLQKDLGGPVKPWKYTIKYTRPDGTEQTMERQVKASSSQLATQAAVQDALNMFEHPQYKTYTPDFNTLKVQIDLPDAESFSYEVPYTKGDGGTYNYEGKIKAQNADAARDEIIRQAQVYFQMNPQFTPDYPSTTITSLDAAWMR